MLFTAAVSYVCRRCSAPSCNSIITQELLAPIAGLPDIPEYVRWGEGPRVKIKVYSPDASVRSGAGTTFAPHVQSTDARSVQPALIRSVLLAPAARACGWSCCGQGRGRTGCVGGGRKTHLFPSTFSADRLLSSACLPSCHFPSVVIGGYNPLAWRISLFAAATQVNNGLPSRPGRLY